MVASKYHKKYWIKIEKESKLFKVRWVICLPTDTFCILWRKLLEIVEMFQINDLACITSIYKGGETCEAVNYKPLALASYLIKAFERVYRKAMIAHPAKSNHLNPTQHDFTAHNSTLMQLIQYYT